MFQRAQRSQSKLRLALIGPSGSGKTYSSLLIAKGLGGSIAMIDTERGSGSLYADLTSYDVCELTPPFTPEAYIQAIREAERAGYEVLVVDSLSHAWAGPGGVLEFVDRATQSMKNNFAAWREASPKHNALVDAITQSKCHIIGTMRSKTAWEVQKDEKTGKTKPVKVGLAPVQRDGLEYEFSVVLELSVDGHIATASKDRTSLFDGQFIVPGVETGEMVKMWLVGGLGGNGNGTGHKANTPQEEPALTQSTDPAEAEDKSTLRFSHGETPQDTAMLITEIFSALRELRLAGMVRQYERYLISKYGCGIKGLNHEQLKQQLENLLRCQQDDALCDKFRSFLTQLGEAQAA